MIKLGQLAEHAINKRFPDNWKSLSVMMNIPYTMYNDSEDDIPEDTTIELEFNDTEILEIKADNTITATTPISNELIAQLVIELAQQMKR